MPAGPGGRGRSWIAPVGLGKSREPRKGGVGGGRAGRKEKSEASPRVAFFCPAAVASAFGDAFRRHIWRRGGWEDFFFLTAVAKTAAAVKEATPQYPPPFYSSRISRIVDIALSQSIRDNKISGTKPPLLFWAFLGFFFTGWY